MYKIVKPTEQEISDTLDLCNDFIEEGSSKFPSMTYEEGIKEAIYWLFHGSSNPMTE